jgi:hypothetical protein
MLPARKDGWWKGLVVVATLVLLILTGGVQHGTTP